MEKGKNNEYLESLYTEQSKHCYPNSDVLINSKGIMDSDVLEQVERVHTTYILSKLYMEPIKGDFGVEHYIKVHKTLFEDLYPFAGIIRNENIRKGNIPFCRPEFIYEYLNSLLEEMNEKSYSLKSEEELITFLAYYYSEINLVHPFREGNGRAQREFFREFVLEINKRINFGRFEIDFSRLKELDKKILILGCIEGATKGTTENLKQFFESCLVNHLEKTL